MSLNAVIAGMINGSRLDALSLRSTTHCRPDERGVSFLGYTPYARARAWTLLTSSIGFTSDS